MKRIGGIVLLSLGLALLAASPRLSADGPAPAPALHPFLYQENMVIDGPSLYWLVAVPPTQRATKALWCDLAEDSVQLLRIDDESVQYMTREEIAAYFSGAHGWPVHLRVKPKSGHALDVDCFEHP